MKPPDTELRQRIALFRYGLINQLLALEARSPERQQRMARQRPLRDLSPGG